MSRATSRSRRFADCWPPAGDGAAAAPASSTAAVTTGSLRSDRKLISGLLGRDRYDDDDAPVL